jgi:Concanavalin A-like lectin/glucanases superfamily
MSGTVWIGLCVLLGVLVLELLAPAKLAEGFQLLTPASSKPPNILTNSIMRRGDVGIGHEQGGYIQDRRYFAGYADVQRYGVENDFCRVVSKGGDASTAVFACALAGTMGDPVGYRTNTVKLGFKLSRDDYMRDIINDGRQAYCRILKVQDGTYQPSCLRALDINFNTNEEIDPDPPEDIKTMLDFYSGCQMWLRLRDDLVDYMDKAVVQYAGGISIDQTPRPTITRGLLFNGMDQFIRFGDTSELSLGNRIPMRSVRAYSVWVNFDKFTNNAHIFDFGDGAGINNVWMGILGKGDAGEDGNRMRPASTCPETTIPDSPSGAQFCPELTAQDLFATSSANVEEYICPGPDTLAAKVDPIQTRQKPKATGAASRATLQYEVWDQKLRKVQIKVNRAIPLQKWAHIVITAKTMDAMRPDLLVYVNGNLLFTQEQGFLPQAKVTSHNYLGKSNWANETSGYELRDELFAGSMFDFRMYSTALSETKVKRILQWGMGKLGLDNSFLSVSG